MGWRIKKSLNLGLGFRINLSKSGIGYSWGFPGYRTTKLANGGARQTYSLPGMGIAYIEQQGGNNKKSNKNYNERSKLILGETEAYENTPIEDIKKNDPILREINRAVLFNRIANIFIFLTLCMFMHVAFVTALIIGIIMKIIVATKMKVKLYYEFDDDSRKMYNSLKEIWIILSKSRKLWQINSNTRVLNRKYNAGAGNNVERNNAFIMSKLPFFIKTNISIYGLNLRNQKVYFTPDRILVFSPFKSAFGCTYRDMRFNISYQRMVESERVYNDSEIVDYTWKYVNVDGSRDLRFNNNRRYPICEYGELSLESPYGINTLIEFSNNYIADDIKSQLLLFGNQFNKILENARNEEKSSSEDEDISIEKRKIKDISEICYNEKIDPIYKNVLRYAISRDSISTSLIQRRFKCSYVRASKMINHMEKKRIIGPENNSKLRKVLVEVAKKDGE